MPIAVPCACGRAYSVPEEHAGARIRCKSCGASLAVPTIPVPEPRPEPEPVQTDDNEPIALEPGVGDLLVAMAEEDATVAAFADLKLPDETPPRNKQYKILTQKDRWFSGKFDPERLEQALNAYAEQGWIFKGVTTASIPSVIGGARDEMIIILER